MWWIEGTWEAVAIVRWFFSLTEGPSNHLWHRSNLQGHGYLLFQDLSESLSEGALIDVFSDHLDGVRL